MAKIVGFSVPDRATGIEAADKLEYTGMVDDVAVVYRNEAGDVRIRQSRDATTADSAFQGSLLGAVVSVFVGPLVGMAAAGAVAGGLYGALRDKGVDDDLMRLAGRQLEADQAAVFVLAADNVAEHIEATVRSWSVVDKFAGSLVTGSFPAEAQAVVRERLALES